MFKNTSILFLLVALVGQIKLPYPITDTIWVYKDVNQEYKLEFRDQGQLISHNPNDKSPINDSWKIKKDKIIFYYNDHYVRHKGSFTHADTIKGFGYTASGKYPFTLIRSKEKVKL